MVLDLNRANKWETASEFLAALPDEIIANGEGESMFTLVPDVRSFGFSESDSDEFMRMCIWRLLDAGAVPVLFANGGELQWVEQSHYGATNVDKAGAIVAEWVAKGRPKAEWDDLWFVSRYVLETTKKL